MNRDEYISEGLHRHLEEFEKCYPKLTLLGIFIQGSQNYNLDIYTDEYKSDIDTKAIVIPSLEDVVMNKKPISTTHILSNNEHLDIKDIRLYFDAFKKQNINFVEILYAAGSLVSKEYLPYWRELVENRELIAHFNKNQAIRCMAGMSMEKKKALCHPYPTLKEKIEKYGYDGKQLHHIIRLFDFITCYCLGGTFQQCLTDYQPHKEEMMKAKRSEYSLEEAIKLAEQYDNFTNEIKNLNLTEQDEINQEALDLLNKIQYNIIKRKMILDLGKELD